MPQSLAERLPRPLAAIFGPIDRLLARTFGEDSLIVRNVFFVGIVGCLLAVVGVLGSLAFRQGREVTELPQDSENAKTLITGKAEPVKTEPEPPETADPAEVAGLIGDIEKAVADKQRTEAENLLARVEKLVPGDPRLERSRESVKGLAGPLKLQPVAARTIEAGKPLKVTVMLENLDCLEGKGAI